MTEPPLPLIPPDEPNPSRGPDRPVSIKVLGVLALLVGLLGTFGCGLTSLREGLRGGTGGGPPTTGPATTTPAATVPAIPVDGTLVTYTLGAGVLDLVTSAVLAVSAFFALRMEPKGRRWAVRA